MKTARKFKKQPRPGFLIMAEAAPYEDSQEIKSAISSRTWHFIVIYSTNKF